ncbi:MAG TPA: hypothetical protein VEI97_04595, partial [bacterium]|nr:hypothetical protein [bacterium]
RPTEDDRVFILESVTGPSSTCFCRRVPDLTRFEFVFNFDVDVPDVNADYDIDFSSTFLEAQLPLGDPLLEEGLDRPPYGFFTSELDRDIIYTRTGSSGGVVRFRAAWLAPEAVVERTLGFCGNDFPILYQISFAITDGEGQSDAVSFPLLIFDNSGSQCRLGNRCQPPASGQC